jgi:transposase InsO family protein
MRRYMGYLFGRRDGDIVYQSDVYTHHSSNGSEFTSNAISTWSYDHKEEHIFTDPGKPMQNGYIESFNGKLRVECLNQQRKSLRTGVRNTTESGRIPPLIT